MISFWTFVIWEHGVFRIPKFIYPRDAHWNTCKIDQWGISAPRASCLSMLRLRVLGRRIPRIAMRLFVDVAECAGFFKVTASTSGNFGAELPQEKVGSNARLHPTTWTRRKICIKLLRVVKYARTLKSIMRPPLLFIEVPELPRKLPTFSRAAVPIITV